MKSKVDKKTFNPEQNFILSRKRVGYTSRKETPAEVYDALGFMSGLEIHQQLHTAQKLFCRCPAGIYQKEGQFDAELIRHMRPTMSELGEYDGTALMEFKTRKTIIYRIANDTACTYDVDDTPPFKLNPQALKIALEIALLLKTKIVGELHVTRKQYLDGSIPTGFQRTAIVGIEGQIPLKQKKVRVVQLSIEEDACREVSDIRHVRTYTTDRLGMPLIEAVTYPDMKTPDEVAEAAQYIRFLTRSTGKVRTGIGAAREDVNVSIAGGTRVEIKGVAHIRLIPELVHIEAFRQKSFLEIQSDLKNRWAGRKKWSLEHTILDDAMVRKAALLPHQPVGEKIGTVAVNLPKFRGILSFFTQPGRNFADEISDRLQVIACIAKPNMVHSEMGQTKARRPDFQAIGRLLQAGDEDAQIVFWGPEEDIPTALEAIEERCRMAFSGVPSETRKPLPDGTTVFERVLPGPDRMYPDTDSAPIPIGQHLIATVETLLPVPVDDRLAQMEEWGIPPDTFEYLLIDNLVPVIDRIVTSFDVDPTFVATLLAHRMKHLLGRHSPSCKMDVEKVVGLFGYAHEQGLHPEIVETMLPVIVEQSHMDPEAVLNHIGFSRCSREELLSRIAGLRKEFAGIRTSNGVEAEIRWIMGMLRQYALGNMALSELADAVRDRVEREGDAHE